jgi:RHS repeat-associated protein
MVTPSGQTYTYHYNGIGSTVAMTDSTKAIVNKYFYTAFGEVTNQDETVVQPFKYVGQAGVMQEPNGFYYMRARYYDPAIGRFISEDPIGLDGGVNLYAYANNNPPNLTDPDGHWAGVDDLVAIGVGGLFGVAGTYLGDVVTNIQQGGFSLGALAPSSSWQTYVAGAVGGAVGAEVSLYGTPAAGGIAGSATTSALKQVLNGDKIDASTIIKDAAVGAAIGYLGGKLIPRGPGRPAEKLETLLFGKLAQRGYERSLVKLLFNLDYKAWGNLLAGGKNK